MREITTNSAKTGLSSQAPSRNFERDRIAPGIS